MFKKLFSMFSFRKQNHDPKVYQELNRLLIKAGRRCAFDLMHAAARQRDSEDGNYFHNRAEYWNGIFSEDGQTTYRDKLHFEIRDLNMRLNSRTKAYQDLLAKHGIKDTVLPGGSEPPF